MAVRVAVANYKGGVGKSATVMMLADGLALYQNRRVLVVDMDPQGMATRILIGSQGMQEMAAQRRTLGDLLKQFASAKAVQLAEYRVRASDLIELRDVDSRRCVDLIPSHSDLLKDVAPVEDALRTSNRRYRVDDAIAHLLGNELSKIDASYDVILFDCPAGPQPTGHAALRLSNHVVAPTNLEDNSFATLLEFMRFILHDDLGLAEQLRVHVLVTMYQAINPTQRQMLDQLHGGLYTSNAIRRPIPHMAAIQNAMQHPGPKAYRSAREKYGKSLVEVEALAKSVFGRISRSGALHGQDEG